MKKRLTSLLLALALLLNLTVSAEEAAPVIPEVGEGDVVILHTNDIHTYIDGEIRYSHIAGLKDYYEAQGTGVLLADSGDAIQGTAYGSMDKGETIHRLMVAAGYDVATLGNHEFDYGMFRALQVADGEIPYLSCNFYNELDGVRGENVLEAYRMFDLNGAKVAFVGVSTPESFSKSTPIYFQNEKGEYIYGIAGCASDQELYDSVQAGIDAAKAEDAEAMIVALGHLGVDTKPNPWTSEAVIANTEGIDLFLDGHSHTAMTAPVTGKGDGAASLVQTGEYLKAISVTVLNPADREARSYLVDAASLAAMGVQQDAEVKAIEDAWIAEIDQQLGEVIGYAAVTLDNYDDQGNRLVRSQMTNSGAFSADALVYLFRSMDMDVDVGVMNGGGIRNEALSGELTYKNMKEIHTFGNVACLITVTGQQLLDALEWANRDVGAAENGSFLHVSGVEFTVDTSIPSTVQSDDKDVWTGGPTGEYRVKDVKVYQEQDGKYVATDLDLNAEYNLAGYNYTLRDLGGGYAMFNGAENVVDYVMEDYMVLANYVKSFPVDETTGLPTVGVAPEDPAHPASMCDYGDLYAAGRITIQ